jgi:hypothetical protein
MSFDFPQIGPLAIAIALFFVMGYCVCYYSIALWKSKRVVAGEVSLSAPLAGEF